MLKNIFLWILTNIFKIETETNEKEIKNNQTYVQEYEDISDINFNAIFGNKLANYVRNESLFNIDGDNARAELLNDLAQKVWKKMKKIASMSFGIGGVLLVPYVRNGKLYYNIVSQNRLTIDQMDGETITGATILSDKKVITIGGITTTYLRWTNYKIENGTIIITQKYTDADGKGVAVPYFWNDILEEMIITNVDRVLFGYIKCPTNNRKTNDRYGVPVTYGCEGTINKIKKTLNQIEREFDLKEVFVGADITMFGKAGTKKEGLPENGLYRKVDAGNGKDDFWEIFDPTIRESSFFAKLESQYNLLEKQVMTSRGILTDPQSSYQNVDETRRAMQDTSSIIDDMRTNIQVGLEDFFYACNVLANAYELGPEGEYKLSFDWSYYFVENTTDTWNQIKEGHSIGVVKDEEVRAFIYPSEDEETRQQVIEEIKEKTPSVKDLVGE